MTLRAKQISLNNSRDFWVTVIEINWIDRLVMWILRLIYPPFHPAKYRWINWIYGEHVMRFWKETRNEITKL